MAYKILPAARNDLIEIADFIALDDPARALSFVAEIEATMATIAERPGSFPGRDELIVGLRNARHGRYLIFFSVSLLLGQTWRSSNRSRASWRARPFASVRRSLRYTDRRMNPTGADHCREQLGLVES